MGDRFLSVAQEAFRRLPDEAYFYSIRFAGVRRMNLRPFPYGIFYCVEGEMAVVLAVLHGARDSQAMIEGRRENARV